MSLSYENKFIDLLCKSMNCFLYGNDLFHETVDSNFLENLHFRCLTGA